MLSAVIFIVLAASTWLKEQGYMVGFNLMQTADRNKDEIRQLAKQPKNYL
jgi:4-hydroxy 2-oxovalerate aldolase